ncbi:putative reverse transcriptase domain-containing protein [Tanacetum coccineum]
MLTARKSAGQLPSYQFALRYSESHSPLDHSLSDSSSETSSNSHSDTSSDSSSRHSSPGHSMLDSPCDSPTATFARPSRKRRRSPTTLVPIASPVPRALSAVRADLLSPRKRIKDSDSVTDFEADIDACIAFADDIAAKGTDVRVKVGTADEEEADFSARGMIKIVVDQVTHPVVLDDTAEPVREDYPDLVSADGSLEVMQRGLDVVMQELYDHMVEIPVHRFRVIESVQRDQGHRIVAINQQSATITMPTATRSRMTLDAIDELIAKRVTKALEAYDSAKNPGTEIKMEDEQQNENVEANGNNGNGSGNGNGNPNPLNFKRTEGVVGLTGWFEKMEMVFYISNCPPKYQVKYASCIILNSALTWWNSHKRKGNDLTAYNQRFQELTLLCTKLVPKEEDQDVVRIVNNLMDQKLKGYAAKNAENKRSTECIHEDCVTVKYGNYKRVGHMIRDCKAAVAATTQRAPVRNQTGNTWYECGRQGHYRSECPKLRNQNRENKIGNKNGNNKEKARAYAIRGGGASLDSNVVTGTFLLNNRYASMIFDSGADRSFVSTTFSALLDVIPSTLDVSYAVELADGRISETNVIL